MTKLFETLGLLAPRNGDFGIEIEVEGQDLPNHRTKFWDTVEDGSLRNGLEYVINGAISHKDVVPALEELQKAFDDEESELSFSFRTSVHVHMNTYFHRGHLIRAHIVHHPLLE